MSRTDIFKSCRGCGKMIGGRGQRNFCLQCTRERKALNLANRVKCGQAKDEPKLEKPKANYDHVWTWLKNNEPVRKCAISHAMYGAGNRPEQAIRKLEECGYLLSECDGGFLYAFEVVR